MNGFFSSCEKVCKTVSNASSHAMYLCTHSVHIVCTLCTYPVFMNTEYAQNMHTNTSPGIVS